MTKGVLEKKDRETDTKKVDLTRSLILGLVGLVLMLAPDTFNKVVGIIVGLSLLLVGLATIYQYMKNKIGTTLSLFSGILYAVLGAIIMVYPNSVLQLVAMCLGVYLLISGILKVSTAINIRRITERWIGTLVIGIISGILGILLLVNPFSGITITKLAGIFLVIAVVFDFIDYLFLQKK